MKIKIGIIFLTICLGFLTCTHNSINGLFDSKEIKKLERIDIIKRSGYYSITFLDYDGTTYSGAAITIHVEGFTKNKPSALKIKEQSKEYIAKSFSAFFNLSNEKERNILLRKMYDIIEIYEKYDLLKVVNHWDRNIIMIFDNNKNLYLYSKDGRSVIENFVSERTYRFPKGKFIRNNIYYIILK